MNALSSPACFWQNICHSVYSIYNILFVCVRLCCNLFRREHQKCSSLFQVDLSKVKQALDIWFSVVERKHISLLSPILLPEGKSAADATLSINYIVSHGSDIPVLLEPVSFIGHLFDSSSCFFLLWGHYNLFHAWNFICMAFLHVSSQVSSFLKFVIALIARESAFLFNLLLIDRNFIICKETNFFNFPF